MGQLGLKLLQALLGLLALGQVAQKPGEHLAPVPVQFADCQLERKLGPVLAPPGYDASETDDPALAGRKIARDVAVVALAMRCRHQHADIAAAYLARGIAEHALGGGAERLDDAAL